MDGITNDNNVIKKNMLYNSVGTSIYLGLQWLITILVARISGYEYTGILTLAMSLSNIIFAISAFGMRNYQSSDINNKFDNNTYKISRVVTCLLGITVCAVILVFSNYSFYTKCTIFIYILFKISEAIVDVLHGAEQKVWRMDIIGKSFGLRGIVSFVTFIITLVFTSDLFLSVLLMAISVYLIIVFFDIPNYKKIFKDEKIAKLDYKSIGKLLLICLPLTIFTFLSTGLQAYPKFILESVTSSEMLGIYSSIATPVLIIQVAASFIFNPLITLFGELYVRRDKKEIVKLAVKIIAFIILLGLFAFIGSIFLGKFALHLLYEDTLDLYSYLLNYSIITMIITTLVTFVNVLLTVIRDFKTLLIGNLIGLVITVILSNLWIAENTINAMNPILIISLMAQLLFMIIFGMIYLNKKFK